MGSCANCGKTTAPADRYCAECGAHLPPPRPHLPPHPSREARRSDWKLVALVVAAIVLTSVAVPVGLYLVVSSTFAPPVTCVGCSIGVVVAKSPDGLTWNMTFTWVPGELLQNGTTFMLVSATGVTLLPATTLYELEGSGRSGVRYIPSVPNPTIDWCMPGDRILIAAGTGAGQYPSGTQYQIANGGRIYASWTLP